MELMMFHQMRSRRIVAALAMSLVAMAVAAHAQTAGTKEPVPHDQIVSANPLGIMFKWFNIEYERRLGRTTTWGVSGSWLALTHDDYVNGNLLFRYYPQGAPLTGFFLGGRTGVHRVLGDGGSGMLYGAGVEIGYSWLLGENRNVGVSIGGGAVRLVGGKPDEVSLAIPTLRLVNVGIAF